ncbi:MAG: ribose-5-phosphate isomerase RpiA [Streptococcaceae bacterium]|jgi:ribose 5-phosphate isomerase A|nr:ribose-5-phosphate isomerase RpiA [Streptococcaceae bacterium]
MENTKKWAGEKAAEYVENGMVVGLGTGSTVRFFVERLGERASEEGLAFTGVTTSFATQKLAESLGLAIADISEIDKIDLTVDGADEIDPQLNGIKGGGGALLMEKIVATHSVKNVWIAGEDKLSARLGTLFKLPVEVVKYGSENLFRAFVADGFQPAWRLTDSTNADIGAVVSADKRLTTDQGHFIIDLHFEYGISDTDSLAQKLSQTVGIVEHGLFLGICNEVIVGKADGTVEILTRK